MLLLFDAPKRRNYTVEALNLLKQSQLLSEAHRTQLLWSRTVNTLGRQGCNVPCDLHMEHLNRVFKQEIRHLGSNLTRSAMVRCGKSLSVVNNICQLFESEITLAPERNRHFYSSFDKDYRLMLNTLEETNIFVLNPSSQPRQYLSVKWSEGLLQKCTREELMAWITDHLL